jgi:opacity protein-like surface antigen
MSRWVRKSSVSFLMFAGLLAATAGAQVVANHSSEFAATMGFTSEGGIDGNTHPFYGIAGSYVARPNLAAVGEYMFQTMGTTLATKEKIQLMGAGARYYFRTSPRLAPYAEVIGGYARLSLNGVGTGTGSATNSAYFGVGGGASFYLTENWGIRPELRYERELLTTSNNGFNACEGTISVFYQFGSGAAKK